MCLHEVIHLITVSDEGLPKALLLDIDHSAFLERLLVLCIGYESDRMADFSKTKVGIVLS